jgi:hypothetical protein
MLIPAPALSAQLCKRICVFAALFLITIAKEGILPQGHYLLALRLSFESVKAADLLLFLPETADFAVKF